MKYYFILFIFFASYGVNASAQTLETKWLHSINSQSSIKGSSKFISNSAAFVVVGVPFALLAEAYIDKNESGAEKGWYIASSVALSGITALVMKSCTKRERPYVTYSGYIVPETMESNSSFPSFHTSVAFSLATSLSISYPKWYVIAPSMLWATSVAYSRMNLGVHYPSDVAAGAVLGAGSSWLTYKMNQWLHQPIKRVTKRSMEWLH